jgi:hypothetical protein
MSRARLLLHGRVGGGPVVDVPVISRVTADGVKRQGENVWLQVVADASANKFKFDIKVAASLTGVTVRDGASSATVSFPYVTTSDAISFDVPASLVGVAYTITGTASKDGGTTYATPVAAAENFGTTSGAYFTPSTIVLNSVDRLTLSGEVPPQYRLNLSAGFYDSYLAEVHRKTALGVSRGISYIYPQTNGTSLVINTDPATDPAPSPPLPTANNDDVDHIAVVSGDWYDSDAAGVRSNIVICPINDTVVGYRHVRLNVTNVNAAITLFGAVQMELAATVGGTNILTGKTYTFSNSQANSTALFNGLSNTNALVGDGVTPFPKTEWAQIDLGSAINITAGWDLNIKPNQGFEARHPRNYELWLSNDPTFATKVVAVHVTNFLPSGGPGIYNAHDTLTAP